MFFFGEFLEQFRTNFYMIFLPYANSKGKIWLVVFMFIVYGMVWYGMRGCMIGINNICGGPDNIVPFMMTGEGNMDRNTYLYFGLLYVCTHGAPVVCYVCINKCYSRIQWKEMFFFSFL